MNTAAYTPTTTQHPPNLEPPISFAIRTLDTALQHVVSEITKATSYVDENTAVKLFERHFDEIYPDGSIGAALVKLGLRTKNKALKSIVAQHQLKPAITHSAGLKVYNRPVIRNYKGITFFAVVGPNIARKTEHSPSGTRLHPYVEVVFAAKRPNTPPGAFRDLVTMLGGLGAMVYTQHFDNDSRAANTMKALGADCCVVQTGPAETSFIYRLDPPFVFDEVAEAAATLVDAGAHPNFS
jgi:hypothetical protein